MTAGRRHRSGEGGFTLVEMSLTMALLCLVMTLAFGVTDVFLKIDASFVNQGQATERAAAVLAEMRSEIASANIVYDPANEGTNAGYEADGKTVVPAGFSLRIYTQLNGELVCQQWRVVNDELEERSWSDLWTDNGIVLPWSVLLTDVDNPSGTKPFVLDYGAGYGGQNSSHLIDLTLDVSGDGSEESATTFETSIAARDAEYYPSDTGDCSPVPTP